MVRAVLTALTFLGVASAAKITHKFAQLSNGLNMHVAECGAGYGRVPVVLLHGYPSLWIMWKKQMHALCDAGYHVYAPDQRGYGMTDAPPAVHEYAYEHLIDDVIGLLDHENIPKALLSGHDWGANLGWRVALHHQDRIAAYLAFGVPYSPGGVSLDSLRAVLPADMYMFRHQEEGLVEDLAGDDPHNYLASLFTLDLGTPEGVLFQSMVDETNKHKANGYTLPEWYDTDVFEYTVAQFKHTGMRGALNWYRAWDLSMDWAGENDRGLQLNIPVAYQPFTRDLLMMRGDLPEHNCKLIAPHVEILEYIDSSHWVAEEKPNEVSERMLTFFGQHSHLIDTKQEL